MMTGNREKWEMVITALAGGLPVIGKRGVVITGNYLVITITMVITGNRARKPFIPLCVYSQVCLSAINLCILPHTAYTTGQSQTAHKKLSIKHSNTKNNAGVEVRGPSAAQASTHSTHTAHTAHTAHIFTDRVTVLTYVL